MKSGNIEIFDGKTFSSLVSDIYAISSEKRKEIKEIVLELAKMMRTPADVMVIGPILQSMIETGIKNDDQLTKLATIVQRIIVAETKTSDESGVLLSDAERDQLLGEVRKSTVELFNATAEIESEMQSFKL